MEAKKVINQRLDPRRKELMLTVMDGQDDLSGAMHILNGYKFCDNFLIWMIHHKWVGKNLQDIIVKQFHSSIPSLVSYLVEVMKDETNGKKLT